MRWFLFIIFYLLLGFYAFQAIKTVQKNNWLGILFQIISLLILANFILRFTVFSEHRSLDIVKNYAIGFMLIWVVFSFTIVLFLFAEDIFRVLRIIYFQIFKKETSFSIPSRRKFISQIALGLAAIPLISMLYGIYRGKYNFKVLKYQLTFKDLPEAFDGYQITQISDIHSGSLDNPKKVAYAVDLINAQQSDLLLFTGDMVNTTAEELLPWKKLFTKLSAKDGKFSILGNHDYGDYFTWNTVEEKQANFQKLEQYQKEMGFTLLKNESKFIQRNQQRLALVGVENWGIGFKQRGDLKKATSKIAAKDFKILMSHDPTHWAHKAVKEDYHYHLTLSGHTHGMQFGIEIPGWIKWSPVQWRYPHWAGMYEEKGQYLNVNRGFGYLAYPGRVGIWPEITVITLKKT